MKAIIFDLDGTLVEFTREYRELLATTFETVTGDVREAWIDTYNEAFFERFRACDPDPVRRAFDAVEAVDDAERLAETLHEREVSLSEPPMSVHADLERLGNAHQLGVLTNGVREWQLGKLRAHDLDSHFDTIVASYDVGAHKPDTAPFRLVEERLPADEYAMIGDSDADIEGARAAGWGTYRYDGTGFGALPDAIEWS